MLNSDVDRYVGCSKTIVCFDRERSQYISNHKFYALKVVDESTSGIRHGYTGLCILARYYYTADPSARLDKYLRPQRKLFNFGKKEEVIKGKSLVNKESLVKLLPSRFAKRL